MRKWIVPVVLCLIFAAGMPAFTQAQQNETLVVSGLPGQTPVLQINGRSYVDIEALARLINGSLSFKGNQVTLALPGSGDSTPPPASQPAPAFSKGFVRAGIEEMSVIREWRSALMNAVENGYPVTDAFMASYRGQASTSLRLASVAASSESDHNAFQLLSNEFDNMQKLSNKVLAARKDMNYISADALKNDPLNQQILTCARALAAMASSGQFQDDGSCH